MSSIGSPSPFFFGGKKEAYAVERSLRFNDSDNTYLNRTPSSASNRRTWTWSGWIKRCTFGAVHDLFSAYDGSAYNIIRIGSNDQLNFQSNTAAIKLTNAKLRDPSAWYHIVVSVDTTNSTAADRVIIYINNARQTLATDNSVSQNTDYAFNTTNAHTLGVYANGSSYDFDGYMAEVNFIDGFAYDPSYFGETDSTTGQWNPKKYTGSYGTNGFYLNFSDTSSLGADSSGNGNNFTPNNFSTSAGEGNDSVLDTPTTNYCTLNPLDKAAAITFKNGNLQVDNSTTGNYDGFRATFGSKTGKYYWEIKFPSTGYMDAIGIARADGRIDTNNQPTYRIVLGLGSWYNSYNSGGVATYVNATPSGDYPNVATWSGASNYSNNDVYMIAVDFGAGKIWWGKNNSWFNNSGTANPATGTDPRITFTTGNEWFPYSQAGDSSTSPQAYNFGQQGFAYTPPSGFVALNSANLPDPTILLPNKHFGTILYTGTGSSNSVSNSSAVDFTPDWVWIKKRSNSENHELQDAVRGATKRLASSGTDAESTISGSLSAFNSNGFTVVDAGTTNESGETYAAWNWNAGDSDGKTYTVTVVSDSGNKYRFDGFGTSAVTLDLAEGGTYIFDQSDASNATHPLRFYTAADKTGGEYTTGVTTAGTPGQAGAYTQIVVAASAPTLYYQCSAHANMGGQVNTNSTLGSSNFDGTKQATVKANATAGFSIGTYTAQSSGSITVGHGLGVAPDVVITKSRTLTSSWYSYHQAIGQDGWILLDSNGAATTGNSAVWNPAPTSSVFTYGSGLVNFGDVVFYAFSEVAGYSKFGKYIGNASSDGTFVFTGFRVAWLMTKRIDSSSNWAMYDNKRDPHNVIYGSLIANLSNAESTGSVRVDFVSNGFKHRNSDGGAANNISGGEYIYLAFAESPFKNARAR